MWRKKAEIRRFQPIYGAGDRTWTDDLLITNQLLYRLSYISLSLWSPGSLQSENYFITVSFCRQLVIFNFRRRSIFAAFCIIRSVFCRKSCKIFRCRSLCSLSIRWNASDSAKKTCWDLPKKFRQFLSLFSVDFLFLPLLPLVFHLHNFFDNSLLQRVIHIFHMVFNIYIFLIFQ